MYALSKITMAIVLTTSIAATARAQDEMTLRGAFEGKMVTVKIDLPATSKGVELYPRDGTPLSVRELADRMKEFGPGIKAGQQVMITKVVVKGNSHIEFQLNGGGYGTFGDQMAAPSSASSTDAGESAEERQLKREIKEWKGGPTGRKDLERRLSNMQAERSRENDRARAEATQANVQRETLLMSKRAQAGSRFNIRFRDGIPPYYKTPQGVVESLAQYVDFGPSFAASPNTNAVSAANANTAAPPVGTASLTSAPAPAAASPAAASTHSVASLKKGLTLEEVEKILGPATTASEKNEGSVAILERSYKKDGTKVRAKFVNGVLVDYTIVPN